MENDVKVLIPLSEARHLIKLVSSDENHNKKYEEYLRQEQDCFGAFGSSGYAEGDPYCAICRIPAQLGDRIEELWVFCKEYSTIACSEVIEEEEEVKMEPEEEKELKKPRKIVKSKGGEPMDEYKVKIRELYGKEGMTDEELIKQVSEQYGIETKKAKMGLAGYKASLKKASKA